MIKAMIRTLPALLLVLTFAGCNGDGEEATSQPASMGALNDTCPIMGGDVDPNADTVSYNGVTVGFCCNGCPAKFNAWSDQQKMDYVAQYK